MDETSCPEKSCVINLQKVLSENKWRKKVKGNCFEFPWKVAVKQIVVIFKCIPGAVIIEKCHVIDSLDSFLLFSGIV